MYIKRVRKRNRGSDKDYAYLHLVENVRTEHGPRQRLLLNLGALPIAPEDYKALANTIEGLLLGQANLLSSDPSLERHARHAVQKLLTRDAKSEPKKPAHHTPEYQLVDVASMQASTVRSLGAEYVGHRLWQELGFGHALLEVGCARHWLPLCEALVVGRLVAPGSERHSWAVDAPLLGDLRVNWASGACLVECAVSRHRCSVLLQGHARATPLGP